VLAPIIDAAELAALRDAGRDIALCDVRWYLDGRSGRAAYEEGHLPGAIHVDLDAVLAGPTSAAAGRHPLPTPEQFALALGALGIGEETAVVAYDDDADAVAARLVWLLRAIGGDAALLDGGITAWSGPLESGTTTRSPVTREVRPWPTERLATIDDALDPTQVVLDARPTERYTGEVETVDARPGHIPGARSLPCRENVAADGRFLTPAALRDRFRSAGVTDGSEVVSYCGSGVTACQNLLALEHAGFAPGRLYPGSWSQYAADIDRPVATGADRETTH